MNRGHLFFDWDDTLAQNIHLFREADQRNGRYLAGLFGLELEEVLRAASAFDLKISRQVGLGRDSYPSAWVACYEHLCDRAGRRPRDDERERVRAIADWPYEQRQPLVDGASETLDLLRQEGYELIVWTAGDGEVQRRKVDESGLADRFDEVRVVPKKDAAGLRRLMGERSRARCVVVGNSAASDVRPALELGLLALHIPADTWAFDDADINVDHPLYVRLDSI
ncbi:MAG: HAD family hydrolase, partial [Bacillota bacterium]